jgi:hypothetical protein
LWRNSIRPPTGEAEARDELGQAHARVAVHDLAKEEDRLLRAEDPVERGEEELGLLALAPLEAREEDELASGVRDGLDAGVEVVDVDAEGHDVDGARHAGGEEPLAVEAARHPDLVHEVRLPHPFRGKPSTSSIV